MRSGVRSVMGVVMVVMTAVAFAQGRNALEVYFIDVEGGQATLFVSPSGESMLVDAGFPGARDGERIAMAAKDAGLKQIDYFLNTHFHADHFGSIPDLVGRIPVRTFVDHGMTVETGERSVAAFKEYTAVREKGQHLVVKAGDKVPIKGIDVQVVIAGGTAITTPLAASTGTNALCSSVVAQPNDPTEDASSVGSVISLGSFRMIDLGDLTWNKEKDLVCPRNLIGRVEVYLSTRHGLNGAGLPALVHALQPRVAVINNAGKKGASREHFLTIKNAPGLESLWQVHYSEARPPTAQLTETGEQGGKALNTAEPYIANLDDSTAFFLRLSARADGSFTVTNPRQGFRQDYKPR